MGGQALAHEAGVIFEKKKIKATGRNAPQIGATKIEATNRRSRHKQACRSRAKFKVMTEKNKQSSF
jgi:hypothetical protein